MSLIERAGLSFQALLNSQFGARFYQEAFLDGIAARRVEINQRVGKTGTTCFLATTVLAFFDQLSGEFSAFGVTIKITEQLSPIVAFVTAATFLGAVIAFIDNLVIQRYVYTLGNQIKVYSFTTFLIDKMAVDIWVEALMPRYFGERSRWGHKAAVNMAMLLTFVMMLAFIAYPCFFVGKTIYEVWAGPDPRLAAKVLTFLSGLLIAISLGLALCFMIRFKFDRADFNEHDLEPTPEFLAEIEASVAKHHE